MKAADGKKKHITLIFIILLMTVFMSGNLYAEGFTLFSVGDNESTTLKNEFGWNETPWLYISLPEDGMHGTTALWKSADNNYYLTSFLGDAEEEWFSLDNGQAVGLSAGWDSIKTPGVWNVNVVSMRFTESGPSTMSEATSFTVASNVMVTPEPVSSILFLAGGGTLAFRRFWGKKKLA